MAKKQENKCSIIFQRVNLDSIFPVLDAISWLDLPTNKLISQFAGIDPRTSGKLLKNCELIGIIEIITDEIYAIKLPYPYKGDQEQKKSVIKEAL